MTAEASLSYCTTAHVQAISLELDLIRVTYNAFREYTCYVAYMLLCEKGVIADQLIVTLAPRSIELVVSIIGTLTSGAAFVPLDATYPTQRIAWMLDDTQAQIVILLQGQDSSWLGDTHLDALGADDEKDIQEK